MTIRNLGSIGIDHVHALAHLPGPGETLASRSLTTGLGGKTKHVGAIGPDGAWAVERPRGSGVGADHVLMLDASTAHAIVAIDDAARNMILLFSGTNRLIPPPQVEAGFCQGNCSSGAGALRSLPA